MQYFVKSKQFNPTNCFYQQQQNENSLIVVTKINPIASRPCVHSGTKFKVLSAYFLEINQQRVNHFLCSQLQKETKQNTL